MKCRFLMKGGDLWAVCLYFNVPLWAFTSALCPRGERTVRYLLFILDQRGTGSGPVWQATPPHKERHENTKLFSRSLLLPFWFRGDSLFYCVFVSMRENERSAVEATEDTSGNVQRRLPGVSLRTSPLTEETKDKNHRAPRGNVGVFIQRVFLFFPPLENLMEQ